MFNPEKARSNSKATASRIAKTVRTRRDAFTALRRAVRREGIERVEREKLLETCLASVERFTKNENGREHRFKVEMHPETRGRSAGETWDLKWEALSTTARELTRQLSNMGWSAHASDPRRDRNCVFVTIDW